MIFWCFFYTQIRLLESGLTDGVSIRFNNNSEVANFLLDHPVYRQTAERSATTKQLGINVNWLTRQPRRVMYGVERRFSSQNIVYTCTALAKPPPPFRAISLIKRRSVSTCSRWIHRRRHTSAAAAARSPAEQRRTMMSRSTGCDCLRFFSAKSRLCVRVCLLICSNPPNRRRSTSDAP